MVSSDAPGRKQKRQRRSNRKAPLYAALDLGTNNCRLLVAEARGAHFRIVDGYSQIVRLGEGLTASGRLSDAAMERTIDALTNCKSVMDRHKLAKSRCIATQACRAAENGPEFIERVREEVGMDLRIIPAQEEARLAMLGCHNLFDDDANIVLVVDIGGGSTELAWVDARRAREGGIKGMLSHPPLLAWATFPLGVVTLTETFPEADHEDWFEQMKAHSRKTLSRYRKGRKFRKLFEAGEGHLIGTSGTVTSLAGVSMGLPKYNRAHVDGAWLERVDAVDVTARLKGQPASMRANQYSDASGSLPRIDLCSAEITS